MQWGEVRKFGRVRCYRTRGGRPRWFIDLGLIEGYGRIKLYSAPGIGPFGSQRDAKSILEQIRGAVFRGRPISEVLALYLPRDAKPNLAEEKLERWLEVKRRQCRAGDISPTYLRELERWARPDGHFGWWWGRSI